MALETYQDDCGTNRRQRLLLLVCDTPLICERHVLGCLSVGDLPPWRDDITCVGGQEQQYLKLLFYAQDTLTVSPSLCSLLSFICCLHFSELCVRQSCVCTHLLVYCIITPSVPHVLQSSSYAYRSSNAGSIAQTSRSRGRGRGRAGARKKNAE